MGSNEEYDKNSVCTDISSPGELKVILGNNFHYSSNRKL